MRLLAFFVFYGYNTSSMIKRFLISFLLATLLQISFAVETVSGDYVIYKDETFKEETWIGFLYYDPATYGAVLYTPSKNKRICLAFSVKTKDAKMELTGQKLISKIDMRSESDIEAVNYLMQILPDLYSWGENLALKKNTALRYSNKKIKNVAKFGGDIKVRSASFVPLFGIENIKDKKNNRLLYVSRIGRVLSSEAEFFDFILPFERKKSASLKLDKNAETKSIKVKNFSVDIDSQWTKITENSYLLGNSAFLTISLIPLAQVSSFSKLITFFLLSSPNRTVDIDSISLNGNAKNFTVKSTVYDNESQTVNLDKKKLMRFADTYVLLSLTVASSDYEKYKQYFDRIF